MTYADVKAEFAAIHHDLNIAEGKEDRIIRWSLVGIGAALTVLAAAWLAVLL